jgi:hypothetical protein
LARRGRRPRDHVLPDTDLPELLTLWNRALDSPYGIAISSTKPNRLLQKLYRARRECGHSAYDDLMLVEMSDEVRIKPR